MTSQVDQMDGPKSPLPRTVSFSTNSSSPLTRSRTSSSPKGPDDAPLLVAFDIPPSPSRPGPAIAPQTPTPTWTPAQDERLVFVRASLKEAQRRWSASQEIWLEEEHALLELRTQHRKTLKQQQQHEKDVATKAAGVWKARTWGRRLSRVGSRRGSAAITAAEGDIADEDDKKKADEVEYAADQGDADDEAHNDDEAAVTIESSDEETDNREQNPRPPIARNNTSNTISTALHRLSLHVRKPSGAGKSQCTSRRASKTASRAPSHPASRGISPSR